MDWFLYDKGLRHERVKTGETLQGDSLLLTTKSPGSTNTHTMDLGNEIRWVDHRATQWYGFRDLYIDSPTSD